MKRSYQPGDDGPREVREKSAHTAVAVRAHSPSDTVRQQKWYQYFSPTDSPEERRLILKLDGLIVVFVFLAYWAKVLDSSATSTAYVSGMKEDLQLYGNQLNYLNTVYMYVGPRWAELGSIKLINVLGLDLSPCKFH